jgi:hypothetical protein
MTGPVQQVKSRDLKALLDSKKKPTRLTGAVEKHILTRPLDLSRSRDILHPSEVIQEDWCARAAYFQVKAVRSGVQFVPDRPALRLQSIFDEGNMIHAKWQGYFQEMGVLYGRYERGDNEWTAGETYIGLPQSQHDRYKEFTLRSEEHLLVGHTDGWIVGLGDDCLIELKSIGSGTLRHAQVSLLMDAEGDLEKAFAAIRRPFSQHRMQGQFYLHLAHLMDAKGLLERPAPNEIVFIYECKANQAYKEFVVAYDPESVAELFSLCRDIAWGLDNDRAPGCSIDPQNGCTKCSAYEEVK